MWRCLARRRGGYGELREVAREDSGLEWDGESRGRQTCLSFPTRVTMPADGGTPTWLAQRVIYWASPHSTTSVEPDISPGAEDRAADKTQSPLRKLAFEQNGLLVHPSREAQTGSGSYPNSKACFGISRSLLS